MAGREREVVLARMQGLQLEKLDRARVLPDWLQREEAVLSSPQR